jgi:signal transduction histidine kinase
MLVRDILAMKRARVVSVSPEATMREAVRRMAEEKIGSILIVDGEGVLHGIFSERDLVRIIAANGAEARGYRIGDIASKNLITCTETSSLEELLTLMSNHTIRHVPVVNEGKLVGMVSARDLMDAQKKNLMEMLAGQKEIADLMSAARDRAEEANRMKTEFLRRMSHELRTPLNVIIGFSDILKAPKGHQKGAAGDPDSASYAGEINMAGRHLLALIDDILSLTQIESGKRKVNDAPLDPVTLVDACVRRFADAAVAKSVVLETRYPPDGVCLTCDAAMIDRMLDNLISNAVKFTGEGGSVVVAVALDRTGQLAVSVADTGIGIPPDHIERVLTPFNQVEGTLDRKFEGTGLGLALVKMMIEMHGGRLELESAPGVGTTVFLRFPSDRVRRADLPQTLAG